MAVNINRTNEKRSRSSYRNFFLILFYLFKCWNLNLEDGCDFYISLHVSYFESLIRAVKLCAIFHIRLSHNWLTTRVIVYRWFLINSNREGDLGFLWLKRRLRSICSWRLIVRFNFSARVTGSTLHNSPNWSTFTLIQGVVWEVSNGPTPFTDFGVALRAI